MHLLYSYFLEIVEMKMIIGHSLIALTGAFFIYDWLRIKKLKQKQAKQTSKTIKLCLTGGPCGGKSEGIECIYKTFQKVSAPFLIAPEAATIIGTSGLTLQFAQFNADQIQLFQMYLMRLQYNLQVIMEEVAKTLQKFGKCPVILCDRGLLDGKAYAGKQNWFSMLKHINITQQEMNSRYKAVIHMQTAAKGAKKHYFYVPASSEEKIEEQKAKGNVVRKQAPKDAIVLDERIQACYENHPSRFIIRNYFFVKDFDMKKVLLIAQVNQILEFVLKKNNIEAYYRGYKKASNKDKEMAEKQEPNVTSKKDKEMADNQKPKVSPYLLRKQKFKKFLKRQDSILEQIIQEQPIQEQLQE